MGVDDHIKPLSDTDQTISNVISLTCTDMTNLNTWVLQLNPGLDYQTSLSLGFTPSCGNKSQQLMWFTHFASLFIKQFLLMLLPETTVTLAFSLTVVKANET